MKALPKALFPPCGPRCDRLGFLGFYSKGGKGSKSGEIIAIITVRVAIAGLNLTSFRALRSEMCSEIGSLREEVAGIRAEITALRERMAHLEGLLEGLREAISGRVGAGS